MYINHWMLNMKRFFQVLLQNTASRERPDISRANKPWVSVCNDEGIYPSALNGIMQAHDDVIKWKQFLRYWPFCAGNSPVTGEFLAQSTTTRNLNVFFDLWLE